MFNSMQSDLDQIKKDGKRLFLDRVNNSDANNMHPVDPLQKAFNKNLHDYPDKSKIVYENPELATFKRNTRNSFVHNTVSNKNKANADHLKMIQYSLNQNKKEIVQAFHEVGIL